MCPHCLQVNMLRMQTDNYGTYVSCLSCGWCQDVQAAAPAEELERKRIGGTHRTWGKISEATRRLEGAIR